MTITREWAETHIGYFVAYDPGHGPREVGQILSVNDYGVLVKYLVHQSAQRTYLRDLTPVDLTPLEAS